MTWIFDECKDVYGLCIRQYCAFALTFLIFLLCAYSIFMTFRRQSHYNFQDIPLLVNGIATFSLFCALSQFEQENIYLIMEVIEIYSYSLLTYSYVGLYLLGTKKISKTDFNRTKKIFIAFSVAVLVGIIVLIVLQFVSKIKCHENHGIGNLVLFILQIPLYIITFVYVRKTKLHIQEQEQQKFQNQKVSQLRLLGREDQYIKMRYFQANLVVVSFTFSLIMHIATLIMFFIERTSCSQGNYISTENIYQVLMFSLFDLEMIIPHVAIPIILYFIPAHYKQGESIIITPIQNGRQNSEYQNNIVFSQFENQGIKNMVKKNRDRK